MAERDFFTFLARCLEAIQRDARAAYRALCEKLRCVLVQLVVDGRNGVLFVSLHDEIVLVNEPAFDLASAARAVTWEVQFETERDTIAALVDGRRPLLDALLEDKLLLRGASDAVVIVYDALMLFLRGAVRSPVVPALLDAYLGRQAPRIHVQSQEAS